MNEWIYQSINFSINLPTYQSINLAINQSINLSIDQSIHPSFCLSIYLSTYLASYLSIYQSIYLSIYRSIFLDLSVCLPACWLAVCLSVYLAGNRSFPKSFPSNPRHQIPIPILRLLLRLWCHRHGQCDGFDESWRADVSRMGEAPWGFRSRCRTWFCRCGFAVNSADRTWDDMGRIEKLTLPHLSPSFPIFGDRLLMHVSSI